MNNKLILFKFLEHLSLQNQPFILRNNGKPPEWDDEMHQQAYSYNPELYALFGIVEITTSQRLRILFQLLKSSRKGFCHNLRLTLEMDVFSLLLLRCYSNAF